MTSGLLINAWAISARRFMPPESWSGNLSPKSPRPNLSRSLAASERALARARPSRRLIGPKVTLSVTRIHGHRAVSWKTMIRSGPGPRIGRASMDSVPASGVT